MLTALARDERRRLGQGHRRARERARSRSRKALLQNAFRAYRDRGASRIGLKVDANNPTGATQLYASVGFDVDRTYRIWAKEL